MSTDFGWKWIPKREEDWLAFLSIRTLFTENRISKIPAIKDLRALTYGGLKECKDLVDSWEHGDTESCENIMYMFYSHNMVNNTPSKRPARMIQMPEEFIEDMKKVEEIRNAELSDIRREATEDFFGWFSSQEEIDVDCMTIGDYKIFKAAYIAGYYKRAEKVPNFIA